jgi:membrane protease YdiL (CAAX protease family)
MYAIDKPAVQLLHITVNIPPVKSLAALFYFLVAALLGGGFREELFFRAYLTNKLTELLPKADWSLWAAASFQILLFAYGHNYQGYLGILETGILGIICTLIYLKMRSLWSAIFFHSFFDVWGILAVYLGC